MRAGSPGPEAGFSRKGAASTHLSSVSGLSWPGFLSRLSPGPQGAAVEKAWKVGAGQGCPDQEAQGTVGSWRRGRSGVLALSSPRNLSFGASLGNALTDLERRASLWAPFQRLLLAVEVRLPLVPFAFGAALFPVDSFRCQGSSVSAIIGRCPLQFSLPMSTSTGKWRLPGTAPVQEAQEAEGGGASALEARFPTFVFVFF